MAAPTASTASKEMKEEYIVGIDPGFSGAITIMDIKGEIALCMDMPTLKVGKKMELNEVAIKELFESYKPIKHVYIEKAQAMPKQGISSTGRYLTSYGILRGICVGLGIPYTLIHPRTWKKSMMKDMPKEKQASIMRVNQLYPNISLPRKKDHHKADSTLLSLFGLKGGKA
jgi:hypothetical protein